MHPMDNVIPRLDALAREITKEPDSHGGESALFTKIMVRLIRAYEMGQDDSLRQDPEHSIPALTNAEQEHE